MGQIKFFLLALTAMLAVSPLYGQCNFPSEVNVPDGTTASNEEMVNGQKLVKTYMAEMEAYLECLDKEAEMLGEEETPEQQGIHVQRHNAAVEAMEATAANFNEQVRAYKSANP